MYLKQTIEDLVGAGRTAEAIRILEQRVALHNCDAALMLAHWRVTGIHLPRDLKIARDLFQSAADWGNDSAEPPLIAMLASGAGDLPRDWPEALTRFSKLASEDPVAARQSSLISAMAIDDAGDPTTSFMPEFLSQDPLVVRFPSFMSGPECEAVIDAAQSMIVPAQVVDPKSGQLIQDPIRDSGAMAFPILDETPFLHALNRRIAAASRSRPEQGEPMQVLAYRHGQQYRLHSDAIPGANNQRIQTVLVYLSDDFEGGATHFPHNDLSVQPVRGDAICFSNVSTDMRPVITARHAGLPVTAGTKYVLSRWIRQAPLDLLRPTLGQ